MPIRVGSRAAFSISFLCRFRITHSFSFQRNALPEHTLNFCKPCIAKPPEIALSATSRSVSAQIRSQASSTKYQGTKRQKWWYQAGMKCWISSSAQQISSKKCISTTMLLASRISFPLCSLCSFGWWIGEMLESQRLRTKHSGPPAWWKYAFWSVWSLCEHKVKKENWSTRLL